MLFSSSKTTNLQDQTTYLVNFFNMEAVLIVKIWESEELPEELEHKGNERKTNYMATLSASNEGSPNQILEVSGKHFKAVQNLVYLGSLINSETNIGEGGGGGGGIRRRITIWSEIIHYNLKSSLDQWWYMVARQGGKRHKTTSRLFVCLKGESFYQHLTVQTLRTIGISTLLGTRLNPFHQNRSKMVLSSTADGEERVLEWCFFFF